MPRRRARRALALLAALLPAAGCAYSIVADGQLREAPYASILERTESARGIRSQGGLTARVVESAELPPILRQALAEEWSGSQLDGYAQGLVALGLWPAGVDLLEEYIEVYSEQVAGTYLPTQRTLYVVRDAPSSFEIRLASALLRRDLLLEGVLAHELVHFLQHQAFPELLEPDPFWKAQDDATAAVTAAIEGDACRYGFAALDPSFATLDADDVREAIERESRDAPGRLAEAPALLRLTIAFPYSYGYALSLDEGRALLERPPASTEQVLHAAKRREPFDAIDLSGLAAALPGGCRVLFENSAGELGISVLLRDHGARVPPVGLWEVASAAWEGWNGDRWLAAECSGRRELVWLTSWDSEQDAAEFADAYAAIAGLVAERGSLARAEIFRAGRDVRIATPALAGLPVAKLARRAQVATLGELRAYFGATSRSSP
jgi:hypothetical protein